MKEADGEASSHVYPAPGSEAVNFVCYGLSASWGMCAPLEGSGKF